MTEEENKQFLPLQAYANYLCILLAFVEKERGGKRNNVEENDE